MSTAHIVEQLYDVVLSRKGADPTSSNTAKLFAKGRAKIAQKLGEEAVEAVIEGMRGDRVAMAEESADLLYHLTVMWADMGMEPKDVWAILERRFGISGIAEKASRPKD
jgi:phosphoribosyl-ATP pyrophosphohydrolase